MHADNEQLSETPRLETQEPERLQNKTPRVHTRVVDDALKTEDRQ